jgi:hypothetical protein
LKSGTGSTPDKTMGFLAFIVFAILGLVAIHFLLDWLMQGD